MSASSRWATFDRYGTLVDWERGITDTMSALWPDADPRALVRYHELEPEMQLGSGTLTDVLDGLVAE